MTRPHPTRTPTPTAGRRSLPGCHRPVTGRGRLLGRAALVATGALVVLLALAGPAAAAPDPAPLEQVINNLTRFIVLLLVALATLFLTVAGVRYLTAAGDPGQVSKAKDALRNSCLGYALAALAPLLVNALQSIVG